MNMDKQLINDSNTILNFMLKKHQYEVGNHYTYSPIFKIYTNVEMNYFTIYLMDDGREVIDVRISKQNDGKVTTSVNFELNNLTFAQVCKQMHSLKYKLMRAVSRNGGETTKQREKDLKERIARAKIELKELNKNK